MIYLRVKSNGDVTGISSRHEAHQGPETSQDEVWQSRWDWKDLATVTDLAEKATTLTGRLHIGVDNGPSVAPRFDVFEAPAVGDKVSYGFNGDYYPDGEIVSVTKGTLRRVVTSTGSIYWRRGKLARWVKNKTWSLVPGHIDERNPHF